MGRNICNKLDCSRVRCAGGYCFVHSNLRTDRICKEENCNLGYYSNGYCKKHARYHNYSGEYRVRNPDGTLLSSKACKALNCATQVVRVDYCNKHQMKIDKGLDPNINHVKGERNTNWNGGVSEYPNHYKMKKLRKEKLELVGNNCEECGVEKPNSKLELHHLDGSKDNHTLENFLLLCCKCHRGIYHSGPYGPSKGKKEYSPAYLRQNPHLRGN